MRANLVAKLKQFFPFRKPFRKPFRNHDNDNILTNRYSFYLHSSSRFTGTPSKRNTVVTVSCSSGTSSSGTYHKSSLAHRSVVAHFFAPLASSLVAFRHRHHLGSALLATTSSFLFHPPPAANRRFALRSLASNAAAAAAHAMTSPSNRPFTIVVEGNIGSGKTTLLQHFAASMPMVETFQEPVNKWRDVKGHNALALMYEDPKRWSLTFQTYVQLTMVDLHCRPTTKPDAVVKMMERSIYSAKYCFVENLHNGGIMPEVEYTVLTEWFDWLISRQSCDVDLIIYLRTSPPIVFDRIKKRCRNEEKQIPLEYLQSLHALHERWLIADDADASDASPISGVEVADGTTASLRRFPLPAPVLIVDGNSSSDEMKVQIVEKWKDDILERRRRKREPKDFGGGEMRDIGYRVETEEEAEAEAQAEAEADSQNEIRSSQKRHEEEEDEEKRESKVLKVINRFDSRSGSGERRERKQKEQS